MSQYPKTLNTTIPVDKLSDFDRYYRKGFQSKLSKTSVLRRIVEDALDTRHPLSISQETPPRSIPIAVCVDDKCLAEFIDYAAEHGVNRSQLFRAVLYRHMGWDLE